MSKNAEQAGLIAYPVNNIKVHQGYNGDFVNYDKNKKKRELFVEGYNQAQQDYIEYAQLWVDSGEVNIKSFKQFLKDGGYE